MEKSKQKKKPHAILVPLPFQGHIIPSIHLALKLASKGFSITFINTDHIHHQLTLANSTTVANDIFSEARKSMNGELDIDYVTVSDGLPVEFDRSLNVEQRKGAIIYCFPAHVEAAVAKIMRSRPSTCCFIADTYLVWASKLANKFGLLNVSFWTEAAIVLDLYFHLHLLKEYTHIGPGSIVHNNVTIDYIPGISSIKRKDMPSFLQEEDLTTMQHQSIFSSMDNAKRADFILCNTVHELEAQTITAIQAQTQFYAIGPLFPLGVIKSPVATSLWAESNCIHWLDSKPPSSVLYVSFGSYAHISKEELQEIANGIKLSRVNFLWVIRPDMVSSIDQDPLPNGFRDDVLDRGMVVTWTCQITVLSHRAIGGFLTHCGWNSTLESIWCEVPLLCYPLLTDQFTNRKLIVNDWKIGHNLCEEMPVKREVVLQNVKEFIDGTMRYELNIKIKEIKQVLENAVTTKGSSEENLDIFIEKLRAIM